MSSGAAPASPSSSPRLPSPPPFPEVQIGPKSPSPGASPELGGQDAAKEEDEDKNAMRRIRPGTKAADMASGPPLIPLSELDSPFQLQEYLLASFLHATWNSSSESTVPITRASATKLATPPENIDRLLWLYELCRLLVQRTNSLIVGFFADQPPCSAAACPEMRASEWQYLCAVHDPPKSCCAIDYCCHTLDWAATVLTSMQHFPSRLTLGGNAPNGNQAALRQLTNIFRRVYRMFAHAWFQHREVFWQLENTEGLYIFYKTVCDVYSLIPEENYTVPPEAEGLHATGETGEGEGEENGEEEKKPNFERQTSLIVEKPSESLTPATPATPDTPVEQAKIEEKTTLSTGASSRRHKHTPSTGSFVTTIQEGDEDDKEGIVAPTTFTSTVRRDPSASPPKSPSKQRTLDLPLMPKIPDIEIKPDEAAKSEDGSSEVTTKLEDMKIEEPEKTDAKVESEKVEQEPEEAKVKDTSDKTAEENVEPKDASDPAAEEEKDHEAEVPATAES